MSGNFRARNRTQFCNKGRHKDGQRARIQQYKKGEEGALVRLGGQALEGAEERKGEKKHQSSNPQLSLLEDHLTPAGWFDPL